MRKLSETKIIGLLCITLLLSPVFWNTADSTSFTQVDAATLSGTGINPYMTAESTLDEILRSVLGASELVDEVQGEALADALSLSSDSGKDETKHMGDYTRYALGNPGTAFIRVSGILEYMPDFQTDSYALLYKIKPSAASEFYQFMIEIAGVRFEINTSDKLHYDCIARIGSNQTELIGKTENTLELDSDQWYNVLVTFGQTYTYQFLLWQDANPSEYIYQSYDLGPYFTKVYSSFTDYVTGEITFSSNRQESWTDVESFRVYRYDGIPEYSADDAVEAIVSAVLGAPEKVAVLRDEPLLRCMTFETADGSLRKTLTNEGGYVSACLTGQGSARDISGDLYFNGLGQYFEGAGIADDRSTNAVLLKLRYTGSNAGFALFQENRNATIVANLNSSGFLNLYENGDENESRDNSWGAGTFQLLENEWYYALIAMDDTDYGFIAWQADNPNNKTFDTYDISGLCDSNETKQGRYIWAGAHLRAQTEELCLEVASLTLYSFTDMTGFVSMAQSAAQQQEELEQDKEDESTELISGNTAEDMAIAESPEPSAAVENINKEVTTYIPQNIQPIEENPCMLPIEQVAFEEFQGLTVAKPHIDDTTGMEDIAAALLTASREVVTLQGDDLMRCIDFQSTDWSLNRTLTEENGYIRALIQTGKEDPEKAPDIWGKLYFNGLRDALAQAGGIAQGKTSAIAVKFRCTGVNSGFCLFLENQYVSVFAEFGDDGSLGVYACKDGMSYKIENFGDVGGDSIHVLENEWYHALLAIDGHFGCGLIVWQESDPANNAFYTCDMSGAFPSVNAGQEPYIWAGFDLWGHANEAAIDIESLSVYEFADFVGVDTENRPVQTRYTYANDDEKYRLAVQLFDDGDYYNAYLLLEELSGYDTGETYLEECERLLQTVPLDGWALANGIATSMMNSGTPLSQYLYVYQAEALETLDLANWEVMDLDFIRYFPNLKELILDGNAITDLTPLKDLYALERLSLAENGVADLTPLANLTNLQSLNLSDNVIDDVSCLGNLSRLKELDLSVNNIHSLDGLYALTELETVDLSYNFISSVNALGNSKLRELNIVNTNINSLWAVSELTTLEVLKAGYYYERVDDADTYMLDKKYRSDSTVAHTLTGMEAISGLTNLRTLYLSSLSTQTMQPLSGLPKLESLTLYSYSGPTDYNVLGGLTGLKELSLDGAGGGFDSLHFLLSLTNLETLEIGGGSTSGGAWPIASLVNLKKLALSGFDTDLSFLTNLDQLRELRLEQWDDVDDYAPIADLQSLEYLELYNTPILDFSLISQIKTLRCIKIYGERINSIEGIDQLTNLEYLYLGVARYSKRSNKAQLDQSLLDGLENLGYVFVCIGGIDGEDVCYGMGGEDGIQTLYLPSKSATKSWNYDTLDIHVTEDQHLIDTPVTSPYLKIEMYPEDTSEPVTLRIHANVRVLGIVSNSRKPIALALDCVDNIALETIYIGHIDCYGADNDGAGSGNFVIDNLDGLAGCVNLREVYINSAEITDISGLAGCEMLEVVELKNNRIKDISSLANKKHLSQLKLKKNQIENFEELYSCIRLNSLDVNLSGDKLSVIKQLPLYGK